MSYYVFVFFSQDAETLARAQNNNIQKSPGAIAEKGDKGMYTSLSLHHLYTLLDCLLQAHRFTIILHVVSILIGFLQIRQKLQFERRTEESVVEVRVHWKR